MNENTHTGEIQPDWGIRELSDYVAERESALRRAFGTWAEEQAAENAELRRRLEVATADYAKLAQVHAAALRRLRELTRIRHLVVKVIAVGGVLIFGVGAAVGWALSPQQRTDPGLGTASPVVAIPEPEAPPDTASTVAPSGPDAGGSLAEPSDAPSPSRVGQDRVSPTLAARRYVAAVREADPAVLRRLLSAEFLGSDPVRRANQIAVFWRTFRNVELFTAPRPDPTEDARGTWVAVPLTFEPVTGRTHHEWVFWLFDPRGQIVSNGGSGGQCAAAELAACLPKGTPAPL